MAEPLRVGVIGLGPRWRRRYLPALLSLRKLFRIEVLCDPAFERACSQAKQLDCRAVSGPSQVVDSAGVEVVLLLDTPWYRLWPVELACRAGKPLFCASSLALDDACADRLQTCVRESGVSVMLEMAPRF